MKRLFYLLTVLVVVSCQTPYQLLQNGKYSNARDLALRQLDRNKDYSENLDVLIRATDEILERERTLIYRMMESEDPKEWRQANKESKDLANLIVETKVYTGDRYDQTLQNMDRIERDSREKLYSYYYRLAEQDLEFSRTNGSKPHARSAYDFYCSAKKYAPIENDLNRKIAECIELGIVYVSVNVRAPFDLRGMVHRRFSQIEGNSTLFQQVEYNTLAFDQDVQIVIDIDRDEDLDKTRKTLEFEKEILVRTDRMRDTSGNYVDVPIYETVKAEVDLTYYEKTYEVVARSGIVDRNDLFRFGSHFFSKDIIETRKYYEVYGDERAVPDEYRESCSRPSYDDDDIYEELVDRIYAEICDYYF